MVFVSTFWDERFTLGSRYKPYAQNISVYEKLKSKMGKLIIKTNPKVHDVFAYYPENVQEKMQFLRELVIETVEETEGINELEETLKWGEPSFLTKNGSTLRMDWK